VVRRRGVRPHETAGALLILALVLNAIVPIRLPWV
jgi:hypothetical protein